VADPSVYQRHSGTDQGISSEEESAGRLAAAPDARVRSVDRTSLRGRMRPFAVDQATPGSRPALQPPLDRYVSAAPGPVCSARLDDRERSARSDSTSGNDPAGRIGEVDQEFADVRTRSAAGRTTPTMFERMAPTGCSPSSSAVVAGSRQLAGGQSGPQLLTPRWL
jgi:hypothetical protein